MGNNHDKYFGKDKRKILVLGLPEAGKTSLVELVTEGKQVASKIQKTKDMNIQDANLEELTVTFFDLGGGERQRVFWKQHFEGTQGIIFLISSNQDDKIKLSLAQLQKIAKTFSDTIPIAICLHKVDINSEKQTQKTQKQLTQALKKIKIKYKILPTSIKSLNSIKTMISWLLKQTKAL